MVENSTKKQPHGFQPGKSGNPKGKPPGRRHATTMAAEALLDGEAEALTRRAIEAAMNGSEIALKICLDRVVPVRKGRRIKLDFGEIVGAAGLSAANLRVVSAMGAGIISGEEAAAFTGVLEAVGSSLERRDLAARIEALEGK